MEDNLNIKTKGTYVAVRVLNSGQLIQFCQEQGLIVSKPEELHVTIAYSKTPFSFKPGIVDNILVIPPGCAKFGMIGDVHLVLKLDSVILQCEHVRTMEAGAQYDWPEYTPHITIEYNCGAVDVSHLQNPLFEIELGAEYVEELDLDWIQN